MTKSFMTSVQGVENVYAQHVPLLMETLHALNKGKLSPRTYPLVPGSMVHTMSALAEKIFLFVVGVLRMKKEQNSLNSKNIN